MKAARNCPIVRTISLLVGVSLIGVPAQAKYGGGRGEPKDAYLIYTGEQTNSGPPWWQELNVFSAGTTIPELNRLINVIGLGPYLEVEGNQ